MAKSARSTERQPTRESAAVLEQLGERIRNLRAIRGMSRKALANGAGVSERFLADVETGVGNPSVLILHRVAEALALPISEILTEPTGDARSNLVPALEILKQLSDTELALARNLLEERFARGAGPTVRQTRIALIGLRGAGKSTLGETLADALGVPFVELDGVIEHLAGMDIGQLHTLLGQSAYRRHELKALQSVVTEHPRGVVIATPGSIVSEIETYSYLLARCFTVWIKASPEEHMNRVIAQGDLRPMAGNPQAMDDLRRILENRASLYSRADAVIDTSGRSIAKSVKDLRRAVDDN